MIGFFMSITWADIGIQAIGFVAMFIGIFSYQAKTRTGILLLQMTASLFWMTQFFLLGAYTGAFLNVVGAVRNLIYSCKEKVRFFKSPAVPALIMAAFVTVGVLTYDGIMSLLPVAAMLISSVSLYITEERKIRLLSFLVSPPWLVYDAYSGSIPGVIAEVFTICSIGIAIWRFDIRKTKKTENK